MCDSASFGGVVSSVASQMAMMTDGQLMELYQELRVIAPALAYRFREGKLVDVPHVITCVGCSQEFQSPRKDAVYCSDACRQAAYRRRKG